MDNLIRFGPTDQLALYLSPGRTWSAHLRDFIAIGRRPCQGVRIDPAIWRRQADLVDVANKARIETVLDPRSLELSTEEGRERPGVAELPWSGSAIQNLALLSTADARQELAGLIAEFTVQNRLSAVLAPTHFLSEPRDPWNDVDEDLVSELRRALDQQDGEDVVLYRSLYAPCTYTRRSRARPARSSASVRRSGHRPPTASGWQSTRSRRRPRGPWRFSGTSGLPLVGLHTGTVGLLLMALGAVGGIESGITDGETFDVSQRLQRPRPQQGKPMGVQVRIYLRTLQTFLTTKEAESFFATRGTTGQHICQGQDCCRRGVRDMLTYPVLHFVSSRAAEVRRLSEFPRHRRAGFYLDETLRPASDKVVKVSRAHPRLARVRDRLDTWHQACTAILDQDGGQVRSVAAAPTGRRLRTRRAV